MSFQFTPLSDEEIDRLQNRILLPEGIYPFIVKEAEEQFSQSGNPMLKVKLGVIAQDGNEKVIFDYIVASEKMMFKVKHFCDALDIQELYTAGSLQSSDCIGRSGKCKIGIQKGNVKDDGSGFYPDKNTIKDYLKLPEKRVLKEKTNDFINDDIGF